MVFGFFGRSKAPAPVTAQAQLHTPSPSGSISSASVPPQSPEHPPSDVDIALEQPLSMHPGVKGDLPPADPLELLALIKKVPAKTLQQYIISRVPDASIQEMHALAEFFSSLAPPPSVHCVRCHKDYAEVENTDRSCFVPHDDDSAEVEYVGNSKSRVPGIVGTTYETLWGCCNKIVEGNGDQGPPDGWCYEGFHTTDIKRARFRADSTPQDDKLISCKRLHCFDKGDDNMGCTRKRRNVMRKNLKEESDEEDYDIKELEREADTLSGVNKLPSSSKSAGDGNSEARKRKFELMEIEQEESASATGSSKSNAKTSASSKAKGKNKAESRKQRSRTQIPPQINASEGIPELAMATVDATEASVNRDDIIPSIAPKKSRKPRRSSGIDGKKYVPPKDEESSDSEEEERRKPKKRKAT